MTMPAVPHRRLIDGFGIRLGLVLTLALLPVGVMGVMQSADLLAEARARSEAALAGETLRAVRPKLSVIQRAQGAAAAMAAALEPVGSAGARDCTAIFDRLLGRSQHFLFGGLYAVDGSATCRSERAPDGFAGTPELAAIVTEAMPIMTATRIPGVGVVMLALHPQADAGGRVTGFVAVAPHEPAVATVEDDAARSRGFALVMFDRRGEALSSTGPLNRIARLLPDGRTLDSLTTADVATFTETAADGDRRAYSLVRLVEGELFALGSWPVDAPRLTAIRAMPAMLFPALMWAVSLIAAWFAAETLVTRHIRRLRTAITAFAGGNRAVQPLQMSSAPREIRETAEAFERMTETILHDEAELENSVHQKEVLLREVHHRVKNNLQLIASIVNMQIRRTKSEEARTIMRSLQDRMLSLATIHNGLYQTADVAEIGVDKLFPGIIEQVVRGAQSRGRGVRLLTEIDPVELTLDRAVPLALLLTEALSNAMRYASAPEGGVPVLSVSFRSDGEDEAVLEVTNTAPATAPLSGEPEPGTGIGTQLLRGFARQLGGQFHREFADGLCRVKVWFQLRPRVHPL